MILVHLLDPERGMSYLDEMWPGVPSIADPDRSLYTDFGLRSGSLREMFGMDVWKAGMRAIRKGAKGGLPAGNVFTMPGMFLVSSPDIVWSHVYKHAGDMPDMGAMRKALAAARA